MQVALCLLFAIIERYKQLSKSIPIFQDDAMDNYCNENIDFIGHLEVTRDSILHQRYDNLDEQRIFVEMFKGDGNKHVVTLLREGENICQDYLRRLLAILRKEEPIGT